MDLVCSVVLRLLARNGPLAPIDVDFGPFHAADFIAPLRGQEEQLVHRAKRPAELVATGPKQANLVIGQCAVAGRLLDDLAHPRRRIGRDELFVENPFEQSL